MGTISINTNTYAPFGTIGGEPARRERDFEAERRADVLTKPDLLTWLRWTEEDFQRAQAFAFPGIAGRKLTTFGDAGDGAAFWSKRAVEVWRDSIRTVAATLGRK